MPCCQILCAFVTKSKMLRFTIFIQKVFVWKILLYGFFFFFFLTLALGWLVVQNSKTNRSIPGFCITERRVRPTPSDQWPGACQRKRRIIGQQQIWSKMLAHKLRQGNNRSVWRQPFDRNRFVVAFEGDCEGNEEEKMATASHLRPFVPLHHIAPRNLLQLRWRLIKNTEHQYVIDALALSTHSDCYET